MMIQACLNGGRRNAGVPATPPALARDAIHVREAGAACLHIHPRRHDGEESLHPDDFVAALEAVRAAVPGMPVGTGSGAWIEPGGRKRHVHVSGWTVLPDYVSVNIGEEDAPDLIALLAEKAIPFEAGIWSVADCEKFLSLGPFKTCIRVLVEMNEQEATEALTQADKILAMLSRNANSLPVLLHGCDASTWPCLVHAATMGLDSRIGFEDTLCLPDGSEATNAELVAEAVRIFEKAYQ